MHTTHCSLTADVDLFCVAAVLEDGRHSLFSVAAAEKLATLLRRCWLLLLLLPVVEAVVGRVGVFVVLLGRADDGGASDDPGRPGKNGVNFDLFALLKYTLFYA